MDIKYKVVYRAINGQWLERGFNSLQLATECAIHLDGIVLNAKVAE